MLKAWAYEIGGVALRQQHQNRNIWMIHSARNTYLKKRWDNLFVISAVTTIVFMSVGFAIMHLSLSVGQSIT